MANISDTINLMKKIDRQNTNILGGSDNNRTSMVSAPTFQSKASESPYADYVKEDLYQNFLKIAHKLRFDDRSKTTGLSFIQNMMDNIKDKPMQFEKYATNYNESGTDTIVESVHNCIIQSYGQRKTQQLANLNRVCGYNEALNNTIVDNEINKFNREIEASTPEKINEKIAERVEKATADFIAARNEKNDRIKDIYEKVKTFTGGTDPNANTMATGYTNAPAAPTNTPVQPQQQPQPTENNNNAQAESFNFYKHKALNEISKIKNEPISLFEAMVIGLSNAAMSNKAINKKYALEDGHLDMDSIIEDTMAIYTVMEECNVYGLHKIDKNFISSYLNALK